MNNNPLSPFREVLNDIDEKIISLLGQRYDVCRRVGYFKKENNIPMMQSARVEEVINRCVQLGEMANVSGTLIKKLYELIVEESCRLETDIIDK